MPVRVSSLAHAQWRHETHGTLLQDQGSLSVVVCGDRVLAKRVYYLISSGRRNGGCGRHFRVAGQYQPGPSIPYVHTTTSPSEEFIAERCREPNGGSRHDRPLPGSRRIMVSPRARGRFGVMMLYVGVGPEG